MQELDEAFAARMKEPVASCPAKAFRQHMEHKQVEELIPTDCPGSIFSRLGMKIPEGDHAVFAGEDILFLDDTPVKVSAQIDDGLTAVADTFAIDNPLFRAIPGYHQPLIDHGLKEFCPKDLCHGFMAEEVFGGLLFP